MFFHITGWFTMKIKNMDRTAIKFTGALSPSLKSFLRCPCSVEGDYLKIESPTDGVWYARKGEWLIRGEGCILGSCDHETLEALYEEVSR